MSAKGFWLSDTQWAAIEPLLPKNRPGARRVDDRRVISGIVHMLKVGFHRWSARGLWQKLFRTLVTASPDDIHLIDSTTAKAHRSAAGGKGGRRSRRSGAREVAVRPRSTLSSTVEVDRLRLK